ncbi:tetratricopeptide repeat protein [Paenibacillus sp. YYML68]|uniref:tetratricopeptide repeat protein n=1 Tax=Paenibacillus sp. YYML68 TaxID=2909250 RepID=UPI00249052AB|nr:tetratricopeptide repeat protein [Paenibacillus sp. YYML68]
MENKKRVLPKPATNVVPMKRDATFFFEKAVQSLDRFHYDKALKYFRRAAEYEPENPVNHCNLAGLLSEMGNYEESNVILQHVLDRIDPTMTECYFYMANNFANMEKYESAEKAIVHYLENDPNGQFLEESEEMMELLRLELDRPTKLSTIKSREGLFEHDQARSLLEEGKFSEAVRLLEKLIRTHPEFIAARNNLALAYYYMGLFEKSVAMIKQVLELEPGNLHALCNLAIFYQHFGDKNELSELLELLRKTYPFHQDHVFKLATTMGILSEHEQAYRLFKRLLKGGEATDDPCLHHYAAVAAYNTGRLHDAEKLWRQVQKLDPGSEIPKFYLNIVGQTHEHKDMSDPSAADGVAQVSYHYQLPFEEQLRTIDKSRSENGLPEQLKKDPLVRASFFWALRHGDSNTKLQVIQAFALLADEEVKDVLSEFIALPDEDDYLKKVAIFVLRSLGVQRPLQAVLEGCRTTVAPSPHSPNLPVWDPKWQTVMEVALRHMARRYDMVQQYDLQTLWVEYLTRVFPEVPKITKVEGWAAALEYWIARMHRRTLSFQELANRYGVSAVTVSKNAKSIDAVCGLLEKMDSIFRKLPGMDSTS